MEIVQSSDKDAKKDFINSVQNICAEANEAVSLAEQVFGGDTLTGIRRELARIMEIAEMKLLLPLCTSKETE